jgi:drug/metabolite transporter (DMT)-like permease
MGMHEDPAGPRGTLMTLFVLTAFTLLAFAANSLLCRLALGAGLIDPASFTTLRLLSGALALLPISQLMLRSAATREAKGSWGSGFALFAYAAAFSLAYVSLTTGMGALLLFGSVQVTMIGAALKSGERLRTLQWVGSAAAVGGLVYLVLPGISSPDPLGALLMCLAGVAWGVYSIRGRGASAPVVVTSGNFLRSAPFALVASIVLMASFHLEPTGVVLAVISGSVTSGLGYVLWYRTLKSLTTAQASVVQLVVPVLAALGGVIVLSEPVTLRLIAGSMLILGGVALAVVPKRSRGGVRDFAE